MLKLYNNISVLHLEPTDVCQAACPLCAREIDSRFNKSIQNHVSVDDLKNKLGIEFLSSLTKMFMCGNYGDPAAGKYTNEIIDFFHNMNPEIVLGMNTNGGLRSADWWAGIASKFNKQTDYVVFSIDGLEDTNHLYRKNVDWNRVMNNAAAFISAGGNAHWDMLVYEHNQHQVDDCQRLAERMGFRYFRVKVSKRHSNVSWLKPPKGWSNPRIEQGLIDCYIQQEQSIYMDAKSNLYPCCFLGHTDYTIDKFETIQKSWNTENCNPVCKRTCSTNNNVTSFTNQWQRNIKLC